MAEQEPRIAIVGGGPGGLTLARILQQSGIACRVFEREPSRDARSQGGSLDLHPESGLRAIRAAGLLPEFQKHARYEDQGVRIFDKLGNLHYKEEGAVGPPWEQRPEVDRTELRALLLDSLAEGVVAWGAAVTGLEEAVDGKIALRIESLEHSEAPFDLVVGADGAWSKVRAHVSAAKPVYSGVTFFDLTTSDADTACPDASAVCPSGLAFIFGDSKAIIPQRNAGGKLRTYAGLRRPEQWADEIQSQLSPPAAAKEFIAGLFDDWDAKFLSLIRSCDEDSVAVRRIYALPALHVWEPKPGVTLLGDAAHLMSPFAGEGVNLAMLDAYTLAREVTAWLRGRKTRDAAVLSYEAAMRRYSRPKARESASNLELAFSADAAEQFAKRFRLFGLLLLPWTLCEGCLAGVMSLCGGLCARGA